MPRGALSAAIREYLTKHPGSTAAEVAAKLTTKGFTLKSNSLIYDIKSKMGKPTNRKQKKTSAVFDALKAAKVFVDTVDGEKNAVEALQCYQKLIN